jgi:hypothetical protein
MEVPVRQAADQEAAEDEENSGVGGGARKKLRLSQEQSAFLEDSFKEHSTLTPVCVLSCCAYCICCICGTELACLSQIRTWCLNSFGDILDMLRFLKVYHVCVPVSLKSRRR